MTPPKDPAPSTAPKIIDLDYVSTAFVDYIVAAGQNESVVNVTLGTIDYSRKQADEEPLTVAIACRLRFSRDFARRLHTTLGDLLEIPRHDVKQLVAGAVQPPDQESDGTPD